MFNSETLEVAIGMAFLFLSMALACTAVREWLEGFLKWRAMDLERGLRTLLDDPDGKLTAQLMQHPVLDSLFQGKYDPSQLRKAWWAGAGALKHMRLSIRGKLPSYIPSAQFSAALLDWVARGPARAADGSAPDTVHPGPLTVDALRQCALAIESPAVQRAVLVALDHSNGDLAQARANIEHWFDGTMDRVGGWYRRRTQGVLFLIGLVAAVGLNLDALNVMQHLTSDKALRAVVVNAAGAAPDPATAASAPPLTRIAEARETLAGIPIPIGWRAVAPSAEIAGLAWVPQQLCEAAAGDSCRTKRPDVSAWLGVFAGWLATAFAVMLGAPFWFDVLSRFMTIRSTIKPDGKPTTPAAGVTALAAVATGPGASPPAG